MEASANCLECIEQALAAVASCRDSSESISGLDHQIQRVRHKRMVTLASYLDSSTEQTATPVGQGRKVWRRHARPTGAAPLSRTKNSVIPKALLLSKWVALTPVHNGRRRVISHHQPDGLGWAG